VNPALAQALLSALRSTLISVGGGLVLKGFISADALEKLVGALVVLLPALWGVYQKITAERQAELREVVAVHVGMVVADDTTGPTPPIAPLEVPALIATVGPRIVVTAPEYPPVIVGSGQVEQKMPSKVKGFA
jgi:hypothetical protein